MVVTQIQAHVAQGQPVPHLGADGGDGGVRAEQISLEKEQRDGEEEEPDDQSDSESDSHDGEGPGSLC